jgi:hypothetical protein
MKQLVPDVFQRKSILWLGFDLCALYGVLFFLR